MDKNLKRASYDNFAWQNGYGIFSIGQSHLAACVNYIQHQKQHHKQKSFQEELREILKKYNVKFDEKYLWD